MNNNTKIKILNVYLHIQRKLFTFAKNIMIEIENK